MDHAADRVQLDLKADHAQIQLLNMGEQIVLVPILVPAILSLVQFLNVKLDLAADVQHAQTRTA